MGNNRIGPLAGYRTGSFRNGLPESAGQGYHRFGDLEWDPAQGRHHDEAAVMPKDKAADYEARLAACADMTARRMTCHEIALRLEVSESTVTEYRRTLRRRAAEAEARASAGGAQ